MIRKLAIISCNKGNLKSFLGFKLRKVKTTVVEFEKLKQKIICIVLPYNLKELDMLNQKQKTRLFKKIVKLISFESITHLIIEKNIKINFKELELLTKAKIVYGNKVFRNLIPNIVRRIITKARFSNLNLNLGISNSCLSYVTKYVIKCLHPCVKKFTIYTDNLKEAKTLEKNVFENVGLALEIKPFDQKTRDKSNILIDIDKLKIIIGKDFAINGLSILGFDINNLDVESLELVAYFNLNPQSLEIESLVDNGKILPL